MSSVKVISSLVIQQHVFLNRDIRLITSGRTNSIRLILLVNGSWERENSVNVTQPWGVFFHLFILRNGAVLIINENIRF